MGNRESLPRLRPRRAFGSVKVAVVKRPELFLVGLIVLAIAWVTLVPLFMLIWRTIWVDGALDLQPFLEAAQRPGAAGMLRNSLVFAAGATAVSLTIGTVLAYLAVRTNVPFKGLVFAASVVPLITPGVLYTISFIYIFSPRVGLINHWLEPVFGSRVIDVYSLTGMVLVEGLHLAPLVFLLMYASFKSTDPSLEESALMSGASRLAVARRITLPLARPAIYAAILVMVVRGLESFEVPALIGMPNGTMVLTSEIWRALSVFPKDESSAGVYSIALLALILVGVFWQSRLTRRNQGAFETISGKAFRARQMDLARWRWPAALVVLLYFFVAVVLPFFVMIYASMQEFYEQPSWSTISHPTFDNYLAVFRDPATLRGFQNSVILAIGAATAIMLFMAVASWIVVRSNVRGGWMIDAIAFIPLTIPGLVLGLALLFIYLRLPIAVYGTLWLLFIAYFTRFMPYGMRYASASIVQISGELEESAKICGASWFQIFKRIIMPLMMPGLLAGWIYIVTVSLRELSTSILLYSPGTEVLSVQIWKIWENGEFTVLSALGVVMIVLTLVLVGIAAKLGGRIGIRGI